MRSFVISLLVFSATPALAQVGMVQGRDGHAGTLSDLGNGIGITSDPHGPTIVDPAPNLPTAGPHGPRDDRRVTPFGTPTPPNGLTAPPVLPFTPNGALLPPASSPPIPRPGSSPGRFGR